MVAGNDRVVFGRTGIVVVVGTVVVVGIVVVTGVVVEIVVGTVVLTMIVGDSVMFASGMFVVVFTVTFGTTSPDTMQRERKTRQAISTAGITVNSHFIPQYLCMMDIRRLFYYRFGLNAIKM